MTSDTPPVAARPVRRTPLTTSAGTHWTVRAVPGVSADGWSEIADIEHPATVPGEVHSDLLAAGLIPDPFDGDNESRLAWIGRTDWAYRATFQWDGGPETRHELVAEGLDTVACLSLNGSEVAKTANQHRSYRFDISHLLVEGGNELVIEFEAPVSAAERLSVELGARPHVNAHPFNGIRKMASSYGWDWGPDLAGVGVWKWLGIESWSDVRLAAVRPHASLEGADGLLDVQVELDWDPESRLDSARIGVHLDDGAAIGTADVPAGVPTLPVSVRVPNVRPWWPRGYGEPALYDVVVSLSDYEDQLSEWRGRVGFRNVSLSTAPDDRGSEYVISVNDQPVYLKGANWIPDDALLTRVTPASYRSAITDAADAGLNLLRVWGGGIYESCDFYSVCDELGIMVWQDFLFACAAYSEDQALWSEVEAEARQAITRLAPHPSLVIWNGNNENIWAYVEWNWRTPLAGRSWGDGYYTDLLPRLVAELDPGKVYTPGSPFSFAKYHHPNDYRHGTMHIWDVWNQIDYAHYRDYPARFVSEFGFQGPPAWSTLTSVVHDQPLDPYGSQMLVHQKAADGNGKLERGLGSHLPKWGTDPVANMDDWHWLTSLNQARAVRFGIEHFRSQYPLNRGTIVWQLNDNWPVISWAAVDSHGIRKPLWYSLRSVCAVRLVTIQPRPNDDGEQVPTLVAHNDSDHDWSGEFAISRRSTTAGSAVLSEQRLAFHIGPRGAVSSPLDADVIMAEDPTAEFVEVTTAEAAPAFWYFVEDTELVLSPVAAAAQISVAPAEGGYRVTVVAAALVKDLALFPDRLDSAARVDSGMVTLSAGESHTFQITSAGLDEAALTTKPVLRSVNDLVAL